MSLLSLGIDLVERGLVPDAITRAAIRRLCHQRLFDLDPGQRAATNQAIDSLIASMRSGPIAPVPEKANEQHYELPAEFFTTVLGPHRKYSACFFPHPETSLAEAEAATLELTCQRAELADGQEILELGCGWGSLSLWMAENFRSSQITAVSNSVPQRQFIFEQAVRRGLINLRVITADMNEFSIEPQQFDRIVSVEMFEHMRNYELLLERIATWLKPDGLLFVHHFCHRELAYPFETDGEINWMGRYFFTGGLMPNEKMLTHFTRHLTVMQQWRLDWTHYQRTSDAWLANLDARRGVVVPILESAYGRNEAPRWFHRWRMFFLAVSELFGYANGSEWFVSQSLLRKNGSST